MFHQARGNSVGQESCSWSSLARERRKVEGQVSGCCSVPHCSPGTAAVPVPCSQGQPAQLDGLCAPHQGLHPAHLHVPPVTLQHMALLDRSSSGSKKSISFLVYRKTLHETSLPFSRANSISMISRQLCPILGCEISKPGKR